MSEYDILVLYGGCNAPTVSGDWELDLTGSAQASLVADDGFVFNTGGSTIADGLMNHDATNTTTTFVEALNDGSESFAVAPAMMTKRIQNLHGYNLCVIIKNNGGLAVGLKLYYKRVGFRGA